MTSDTSPGTTAARWKHAEFTAPEYLAGGRFGSALYRYEQTSDGWRVFRNEHAHLDLGAGYRMMRVLACGVCATDLAREHLPFPLPQITGHEVLAVDERGQRYAIEINASHAARGVAPCAFCVAGLPTHCPERLVLGIHDLPGGFGPWILAPVHALVPIPAAVDDASAVLVEPLAAALHAVRVIDIRPGDTVAVLGPRRLGMLMVAALHAFRADSKRDFSILALSRHDALLQLAGELGADQGVAVRGTGEHLDDQSADIVIDTIGNPQGLELAIRLARREVHLKSTHGRPAAGVNHLTEMVVDELALRRIVPEELAECGAHGSWGTPLAWLAASDPPAALAASGAVIRGEGAALMAAVAAAAPGLPRVNLAVADSAAQVADAIRPGEVTPHSVVRPRGDIGLLPAAVHDASPLVRAVAGRGLRLTTSRCGDLHDAAAKLDSAATLRGVGARMVTHWFDPDHMTEAFTTARSASCIKAVVRHDGRS
jgi:threonine dehydrogenase-like Zn-dependent dehydrogenase